MTDPSRQAGRVTLVGAGPGAPGLLTLRGAECLKQAEVVLYDHLANIQLLSHAPADAERIFAGKTVGKCALPQDAINDLLVDRARKGLRVVRLKGGDPYVFGRGAEEAEYLHAHGVTFEIVPGVTAGVGVTAFAGLPVTHRDVSSAVAFVTGHDDPEAVTESSKKPKLDWPALAGFPGTLVIYMGVTRLSAVCRTLIREGKASTTPAALVDSGTLSRQRTIVGTLEDLADKVNAAGLGPPSLLIVGDIVARRGPLNWFESLPLFGQSIIVTRPEPDAIESSKQLESLGAEVILAPMVRIDPLDDWRLVDQGIARITTYDWLIFTSMNGVRAFLGRLLALGKDLRTLGTIKIASIGPATSETLREYHLNPDLVATSFRSEGLVEQLKENVQGCRILLAQADRGRTILLDELSPIADIYRLTVYKNVDIPSLPDSIDNRISHGKIDWITITSSAIVERLHALLSPESRAMVGTEIKLASLSPLTSASARKLGWEVTVESPEAKWESLVQSICEFDRLKP